MVVAALKTFAGPTVGLNEQATVREYDQLMKHPWEWTFDAGLAWRYYRRPICRRT